ncbi:MAG: SIR2 family protein [Planctomycetaceae bacterium]
MFAAIDQLRKAWKNKNLIPVVGAGVSIGAANLPDWSQLLALGKNFVCTRPKLAAQQQHICQVLDAHLQTGNLMIGFSALRDALLQDGPNAYHAFLESVFGSPVVSNTAILNAIRSLGSRVIVTTNLDTLLTDHGAVSTPLLATWQQPDRILNLLRGDTGVIHLHGVYSDPPSVILTESDYTRINLSHSDQQAVIRSLFYSGVLMFVGCSADGVGDPHLRPILQQFASIAGSSPSDLQPHFFLHRGQLSADDRVLLRSAGITPVSYGDHFSKLPAWLETIPVHTPVISVTQTRHAVTSIRTARSLSEVLSIIRTVIEHIFAGRQIRVAFAQKVQTSGRTQLRMEGLIPTGATHNNFSYPQTLASWALIEGRILDWQAARNPQLPGRCDFERLKLLGKFELVRQLLMDTDPADRVLPAYLDPHAIRCKTADESLELADIYQHWVGKQAIPHYSQFVSVPVPVIDRIQNQPADGWPEYGVLNIDCLDLDPLLTTETAPLLELASHLTALGIEHLQLKGIL